MQSWDDWIRVCYHEAGHAVVSQALGFVAVPIVLRCNLVQGQLQAQGTYQLPETLPFGKSPEYVLHLIMRLAAGGVAEEIQFGNYSEGVTGDHSKIEQILNIVHSQQCLQERQNDYPVTRTLLEQNWLAVIRIAEIALRRFQAMNLINVEFTNTQVLSTNAVSRIYTNPPLTQQQHADAQVKAFLYARDRGNREEPEYQQHLAVEDFKKAAGDVFGELQFRPSRYIDFNTGHTITAPMELKSTLPAEMTLDQKIDLFECRVEVWHLGVAAAILKQIESAKNPSIWSHAAYGLIAITFTYFEMIGKTLNPDSQSSGTSSDDFNYGFCNVYSDFKPTNGVYTDKLPVPSGTKPQNNDPEILKVKEFRNRIRNGIYHLGYTKKGLWIHNDIGRPDFEIEQAAYRSGGSTINTYRMNPHGTTRTVIEHFARFISNLRDPTKGLQKKFLEYFDKYHNA